MTKTGICFVFLVIENKKEKKEVKEKKVRVDKKVTFTHFTSKKLVAK